MASEASFRSATNADADAIRGVVFTVLGEYGLSPDPQDTDADLADIEAHYIAPGGMFEVIELDGEIVGTVGLLPLGPQTVELRKMYLQTAARGRGLGKRSMERALEFARRHGFRRMELETAGVLREAIGLYERYGFRPIEGREFASRCDRAMYLDVDPNPERGSR